MLPVAALRFLAFKWITSEGRGSHHVTFWHETPCSPLSDSHASGPAKEKEHLGGFLAALLRFMLREQREGQAVLPSFCSLFFPLLLGILRGVGRRPVLLPIWCYSVYRHTEQSLSREPRSPFLSPQPVILRSSAEGPVQEKQGKEITL